MITGNVDSTRLLPIRFIIKQSLSDRSVSFLIKGVLAAVLAQDDGQNQKVSGDYFYALECMSKVIFY